MKRFVFLAVISFLLSSCLGGMVINDGGTPFKNSVYYSSIESVGNYNVANVKVQETEEVTDEESYEEKLRKFDRLTYTVNLQIDPFIPYYDWRFSWGWRYNYYPYRYTWYDWTYAFLDWALWYPTYSYSWYRPYYTYSWYRPYHRPRPYYHHSPFKPRHDVRYTRRGSVTPPRKAPDVRHKPSTARPATPRPGSRPTTYRPSSRPSGAPNRNATQTRRPSTDRTATQSRNQARPVQNQTQRTGYSRGTTNRSSNTGRDYYRSSSPAQRSQPSVRYSERSTGSHSSGASRSSGGGSSTRRK